MLATRHGFRSEVICPTLANVFTHGSSTSRPFDNGLNAMAMDLRRRYVSDDKFVEADGSRIGPQRGRSRARPNLTGRWTFDPDALAIRIDGDQLVFSGGNADPPDAALMTSAVIAAATTNGFNNAGRNSQQCQSESNKRFEF